MEIVRLNHDDVMGLEFVKNSTDNISLLNDGDWWGLTIDNEIVSILKTLPYRKDKITLSGLLTNPDYRNNGYMSLLINVIINVAYPNVKGFVANCHLSSKHLFERNGFVFKRDIFGDGWHMYRMELEK